jgi:hypothetical protein
MATKTVPADAPETIKTVVRKLYAVRDSIPRTDKGNAQRDILTDAIDALTSLRNDLQGFPGLVGPMSEGTVR